MLTLAVLVSKGKLIQQPCMAFCASPVGICGVQINLPHEGLLCAS